MSQQDYSNTLNLPKTEFSMRADLPKKEPNMVKEWEDARIYDRMVEHNAGKPLFMFHDGPPYANANIHLGTALNKVLKDMIVRHKNLSGFQAPYTPGWDTHGLPIELKAIKEIGVTTDFTPIELRKVCHDFALRFVENQKAQFKRLGTVADYDHPYLTLQPEFEARQIEIFGEMANKGYIYKGLKPVYWCAECETALAEAEIEYSEDKCFSIYVKFHVVNDKNGVLARLGAADLSKTYFVIWTTTTWTLPGNMATCLGGAFDYCVVSANGEYYVVAKELVESTMKAAKIEQYEILGSCKGSELEYIVYEHPFLDRQCPVILGDHVTLESGTGCVHTAPGHGVEDFDVCAQHYPEIKVVVPVDQYGKLTEEAGQFAGLSTEEAGKVIAKHLETTSNLFAVEKIVHQYPHCWRCKEPIIYRATEQWFCSIDEIKEKTIEAINQVNFIPPWGQGRMINMVRDRSDWCISRQRTWGVPIPIFYCNQCGKYHVDEASIRAVSDLFRAQGSDVWYTSDVKDILPAGTKCKYCGSTEFTKETDIMDVWFDSGTSYASVIHDRQPELRWPVDLYMEGTDQYRGWFQSSLLTSIAWKGVAPYKSVCTHGWVVDGEGRKMSKSIGNGIEPDQITDKYGADILRLWVASADYHADIRISDDILKQLSEVYRKIRNTARYILGNLDGFDPARDMVQTEHLLDLDKWALAKFNQLLKTANEAYERYEFHIVYHALHNFCTIDMSNFYLDVIKDRLYVEKTDSEARRSAQTAIYLILRGFDMLIAPILPFTAEEVWSYMPADSNYTADSVMLNEMPKAQELVDQAFMEKWDSIHAIRDDVLKALEEARAEKVIGKSMTAKVTLHADGELGDFLAKITDQELAMIFIVSQVVLEKNGTGAFAGSVNGLSIDIDKAAGELCPRCWAYSDTVGKDAAHPELCARCAAILAQQ